MSANPLLSASPLPNHAPAFDKIKEEHFLPAVEAAIEEARANIEAVKAHPEAPSFENTIVAMETASEKLGVVTSVFYNQLSANSNDELHALAEKIGPISSNFSSDIVLDADLFARVKAVHDQKDDLDLTPEQTTLLEDTYKGFVRGGALLDETKQKRLREVNERMSVLSPTFMNNVQKSSELFELVIDDKNDLSGLPDSAIEAAAFAAKEKDMEGKWLFTLDYPSYVPFVQYADNRELREKIWHAFGSRAFGDEFDNSETLIEIVTLRNERAQLIGYDTHADFVLERRMAEKPAAVWEFLEKLKSAYLPAAKEDLKRLQDFAKENGATEDLQPWDVAYYSEKLKESLYDFSSEDLRPYFPLDTVLDGCFTHFTKLFNIRFEKNTDYPVWHKDVVAYDVFDNDSGKFTGTFYADFFPRTGKKPGAWMTSYRNQGLFQGNIERPVIAIVCNFTKPTGDKPSLLTFGEVETLFHEMGHAMHGMLANTTYSSLSGTNVLWDFVELPSQLQENWCYTKETLDMISGHYETGEKVPPELIEKLNAAKNFMVAWGGLRQVNFAMLDMHWHTTNPADIKSVESFEDEKTAETSLFPRLAGPFSCSFGHLFAGGYAAGYYSYKWAEVLDADTFEAFIESGLYDAETARRYKEQILAIGGSEHPKVIYNRFRGRDADPEALLRREGLIPDNKERAA
jgi:peptidyl-dipeptidase Dcp